MGESNGVYEHSKRVELIDKITPSPYTRAQSVYTILRKQNLSNWDLVCFCIEFLALQAHTYNWLTSFIKPLARIVYTTHYYEGESIGLYENPKSDTPP